MWLIEPRRALVLTIIVTIAAIICIKWVGDVTVYSEDKLEMRAAAHDAILRNEPPYGGSWSDVGMNSTNVRLLMVLLADCISTSSGLSLNKTYRALDLFFLIAALLTVYGMLRTWFSPEYCLLGLLLLAMLMPMSMFFGAFHPWDKPSVLLWAIMVHAAASGRFSVFCAALFAAVLVKFDSVTAVAIWPMAQWTQESRTRTLWRTGAAGAIACLTMAALMISIPGGMESRSILSMLKDNVQVLIDLGVFYPPLLAHGLLIMLGCIGWKQADVRAKGLWLAGILLLVPHAAFTHFAEVRAQIGNIICMLPLAVFGLQNACAPNRNQREMIA
jgi:hypothetical protein